VKGSDTRVDITKSGSDTKIKTEYGSFTTELMPGNYDVTINGIKVAGVAVQSHADTRVRVGVLHINATAKTRFDLFAPAGKSPAKAVYGEAHLGFPAGNVEIEVSGQRESLVIEDGKVTEY
jgi:lipoate-protein ligase A